MIARLYSNVPNTPDLEIASEVLCSYTATLLLDKDIDFSLENAIGYKEATAAIGARAEGECGDVNPTDVYAELASLRIVGTR